MGWTEKGDWNDTTYTVLFLYSPSPVPTLYPSAPPPTSPSMLDNESKQMVCVVAIGAIGAFLVMVLPLPVI